MFTLLALTLTSLRCNNGIVIVDVKNPEKPIAIQSFTAGGKIDDARQVKIAMTNASLFAYVADGKNGLRILQLTSPETMPTYAGFQSAATAATDRDLQNERRSSGCFKTAGSRSRSR
jgi:hypothetical protein